MNRQACYELFELCTNATLADIRRAYKRLALKLHPDKNHSRDTSVLFMQIQCAYEKLTKKRLCQLEKMDNLDETQKDKIEDLITLLIEKEDNYKHVHIIIDKGRVNLYIPLVYVKKHTNIVFDDSGGDSEFQIILV